MEMDLEMFFRRKKDNLFEYCLVYFFLKNISVVFGNILLVDISGLQSLPICQNMINDENFL